MASTETLTVWGNSDDLLLMTGKFEFEGDCFGAGPIPVYVNGEHALTVEYTRRGLWKIEVLDLPEGVTVEKTLTGTLRRDNNPPRHPAPYDRFSAYSDVVVLSGPIESASALGQDAWDGEEQ